MMIKIGKKKYMLTKNKKDIVIGIFGSLAFTGFGILMIYSYLHPEITEPMKPMPGSVLYAVSNAGLMKPALIISIVFCFGTAIYGLLSNLFVEASTKFTIIDGGKE